MKNNRILACILASAMICGAFASCGESSSSKADSSSSEAETSSEEVTSEASSEEDTSEAEASTEAASAEASTEAASAEASTDAPQAIAIDDVEVEPSIAAESGDAYLAINEQQGWIQYWGKNDDPNSTMLSYNAKVAKITGDGQYTVGVTADTNGFRLDTTGDANDYGVTPSGLMFSALMVKDGKTLFPDAVLTIDSITVDGKEITPVAKNYTSSDDGKELRSNIYNQWVNNLPEDAVSTEGALVVDKTPTDAAAAYSPCIVDLNDFATWTTVEVTFTITNTGL